MRLTLLPDSNTDRWASPAWRDRAMRSEPARATPYWAVGAAMATHVLLLATLSRLTAPPVPQVVEQAGFPLVLQSLQPLAAAALSPAASLAPRLASLPGLAIATSRVAPPAATLRHAADNARRSAADRAFAAPPSRELAQHGTVGPGAPVLAPPKPRAGADGTALLPALEARIDEAVRQAASMPEAARRQHREGRARVKFTYVDGRVNGVQVVAPSASRLLDDAALQAVSRAAYPPPPESLRGRHLDLAVWVDFRMDA